MLASWNQTAPAFDDPLAALFAIRCDFDFGGGACSSTSNGLDAGLGVVLRAGLGAGTDITMFVAPDQ